MKTQLGPFPLPPVTEISDLRRSIFVLAKPCVLLNNNLIIKRVQKTNVDKIMANTLVCSK